MFMCVPALCVCELSVGMFESTYVKYVYICVHVSMCAYIRVNAYIYDCIKAHWRLRVCTCVCVFERVY